MELAANFTEDRAEEVICGRDAKRCPRRGRPISPPNIVKWVEDARSVVGGKLVCEDCYDYYAGKTTSHMRPSTRRQLPGSGGLSAATVAPASSHPTASRDSNPIPQLDINRIKRDNAKAQRLEPGRPKVKRVPGQIDNPASSGMMPPPSSFLWENPVPRTPVGPRVAVPTYHRLGSGRDVMQLGGTGAGPSQLSQRQIEGYTPAHHIYVPVAAAAARNVHSNSLSLAQYYSIHAFLKHKVANKAKTESALGINENLTMVAVTATPSQLKSRVFDLLVTGELARLMPDNDISQIKLDDTTLRKQNNDNIESLNSHSPVFYDACFKEDSKRNLIFKRNMTFKCTLTIAEEAWFRFFNDVGTGSERDMGYIDTVEPNPPVAQARRTQYQRGHSLPSSGGMGSSAVMRKMQLDKGKGREIPEAGTDSDSSSDGPPNPLRYISSLKRKGAPSMSQVTVSIPTSRLRLSQVSSRSKSTRASVRESTQGDDADKPILVDDNETRGSEPAVNEDEDGYTVIYHSPSKIKEAIQKQASQKYNLQSNIDLEIDNVTFFPIPLRPFAELLSGKHQYTSLGKLTTETGLNALLRWSPKQRLGTKGGAKTAHYGKLTVHPLTSRGLGQVADEEVAVKLPYKPMEANRKTIQRLPANEQYSFMRREAETLYWASAMFDDTTRWVESHNCVTVGPDGQRVVTLTTDFGSEEVVPIPRLRYVKAGMAIASGKDGAAGSGNSVETFLIEELIPTGKTYGQFKKYIHNVGARPELAEDDEDYVIAEYLSFTQHVQWERFCQTAYLANYQGGRELLTDPQVMTNPSLGELVFADGNLPLQFEAFPKNHPCNRWCRAYSLTAPEPYKAAESGRKLRSKAVELGTSGDANQEADAE